MPSAYLTRFGGYEARPLEARGEVGLLSVSHNKVEAHGIQPVIRYISTPGRFGSDRGFHPNTAAKAFPPFRARHSLNYHPRPWLTTELGKKLTCKMSH